jgi:PAS domain S-box-containing protein
MGGSTVNILLSGAETAELLIESIRDYAIYVLEPGGHVATWYPGAERIKGYSAAEIIGRHFSLFYVAADRDAGVPAQELVAAAEGRYEGEGWRVRKDGSRFWANVVITPLRDGSGTFLGFAKVTRDLTERRNAEVGRAVTERAQAALRIRDDFNGAKHELDTVLATIRSHLRSLEAVMGPLDQNTAQEIKAKTATLGWSLDRISRSMESVVGLAASAAQRLSGSETVAGVPDSRQ